MKWIVEYILKNETCKRTARFMTREEAYKFIDEKSDECSDINLLYDWDNY